MSRFFTSDQHFGHANILKYTQRPWATLDEMHAGLVDAWNTVVGTDDTVIMFGDLSYKNEDVLAEIMQALNGTKCLVSGNHDRTWIGHVKTDGNGQPILSSARSVQAWVNRYEEMGIQVLSQGGPVEVIFEDRPDLKVLGSHFPYEVDDRHGERFIPYQPVDEGAWLLHGHVHEEWWIKGRQINVGVDTSPGYRPVSDTEVLAMIDAVVPQPL